MDANDIKGGFKSAPVDPGFVMNCGKHIACCHRMQNKGNLRDDATGLKKPRHLDNKVPWFLMIMD